MIKGYSTLQTATEHYNELNHKDKIRMIENKIIILREELVYKGILELLGDSTEDITILVKDKIKVAIDRWEYILEQEKKIDDIKTRRQKEKVEKAARY